MNTLHTTLFVCLQALTLNCAEKKSAFRPYATSTPKTIVRKDTTPPTTSVVQNVQSSAIPSPIPTLPNTPPPPVTSPATPIEPHHVSPFTEYQMLWQNTEILNGLSKTDGFLKLVELIKERKAVQIKGKNLPEHSLSMRFQIHGIASALFPLKHITFLQDRLTQVPKEIPSEANLVRTCLRVRTAAKEAIKSITENSVAIPPNFFKPSTAEERHYAQEIMLQLLRGYALFTPQGSGYCRTEWDETMPTLVIQHPGLQRLIKTIKTAPVFFATQKHTDKEKAFIHSRIGQIYLLTTMLFPLQKSSLNEVLTEGYNQFSEMLFNFNLNIDEQAHIDIVQTQQDSNGWHPCAFSIKQNSEEKLKNAFKTMVAMFTPLVISKKE